MKRTISLLLALLMLLAMIPEGLAYSPGTGHTQHDFSIYEHGKEPSCTEWGVHWMYCTVPGCIERLEVKDPPLGHKWGEWVTRVAPTCTEGGVQYRWCERCQEMEGRDIPAAGHKWDGGRVTKEPTCTAEGERLYTCTVCGATRTEPIAKAGHKPVSVAGKAPTCTETGLSEGSRCSVCGTVLTAQQTIDALGHNWGSWTDGEPANCVKHGTRYHTCKRCGVKEWERNYEGGLGDHVWGEWQVVKPATATEMGLEERVCQIEPSHREQRDIPPLGSGGTPEPIIPPVTVAPTTGDAALSLAVKVKDEKEFYSLSDTLAFEATVTNTGSVTLYQPVFFIDGHSFAMNTLSFGPGEDRNSAVGSVGVYNVEDGYAVYRFVATAWTDDGHAGTDVSQVSDVLGTPNSVQSNVVEIRLPLEKPQTVGSNPALSLTVSADPDEGKGKRYEGAPIEVKITLTNTGDTPLYILGERFPTPYDWQTPYGWSQITLWGGKQGALLNPGESLSFKATYEVDANSVQTGFMQGTVGDAGYYQSETGEWKYVQAVGAMNIPLTLEGAGEDVHPALYLQHLTPSEAGQGKRYPGATVPLNFAITNTGDCTVTMWMPGVLTDVVAPRNNEKGWPVLEPGETLTFSYIYEVKVKEAEQGVITLPPDGWWISGEYERPNGQENGIVNTNDVKVVVPLTYPEGYEEENPTPALLLVHLGDSDAYYNPVTKEVLNFDEGIWADVECYNTGSMPLRVVFHAMDRAPEVRGVIDPGEKEIGQGGYSVVGDYVAPGTETDELMGIATIVIYATGHDPQTDEELCRSNEIVREWKVGKPGPIGWELPDETSMLITQNEASSHGDPVGYQLGEWYVVDVYVENTSPDMGIPAHSLYYPTRGETDEVNKPLDPGNGYVSQLVCATVTQEDVDRGYIYFPPVVLTWMDPVSCNEITGYSNSLFLPVINKVGLVLNKTVKNTPANGEYFTPGENIEWGLTVTNNSKDTIYNVTVTDFDVVVDEINQINPGQTLECQLPKWEVSELDTVGSGIVLNMASATGVDVDGRQHMYFSNIAAAYTGEKKPGGGTSTTGGTDPLGPAIGIKVGAKVIKTELSTPANGEYYQLNETIDYQITVKNTGDVTLENLTVYDSLAGLAPIGTAGSLDAGMETNFPFSYTVTAADVAAGSVVNTAVAQYTFSGGVPGTPATSNQVTSKTSDDRTTPGGGTFDPGKLPGEGEKTPLVPVITPDGTPVTQPDGTPTLAPDGTVPVLGPDGTVVTNTDGYPVLKSPDGDFFIIDKDGKPILTDEWGNPIKKDNGGYTYLNFDADVSCELRLDTLGANEAHYTLHACHGHLAAAQAAEQAAAAGTAAGWKQAGSIWREEIDKLYQILFDAADATAKGAVLGDRATFYAYLGVYETMQAKGDQVKVQKAIAEMLRLHCAELCCMVHTVPNQLPESLLGSHTRLMNSGVNSQSSRTIGALTGSDSSVSEYYSEVHAAALGNVLAALNRADSAQSRANAFIQAQRQWQMALDRIVNANYKAADKEGRKAIAACRVMLDQMYGVRNTLLTMLYAQAPDVAQEALANLYRNAVIDACEAK